MLSSPSDKEEINASEIQREVLGSRGIDPEIQSLQMSITVMDATYITTIYGYR
jgi:hypothetical protein